MILSLMADEDCFLSKFDIIKLILGSMNLLFVFFLSTIFHEHIK